MRPLPGRLHPLVALVAGAAIFAGLSAATTVLMRAAAIEGAAVRQVALKSALLVVAFALMALARRPRADWGLALPRRPVGGVLVPTALGGVLGAGTTAVVLGAGFAPMAGLREFGFLQLVAIVWFGSTLAEEVFVRGLVQGWMQPPRGATAGAARGAGGRIGASGALFGALHLTLFLAGNDPRTATTIVVATTLLGLVCAWSRERSGSLVGPLLAHFAFNACGLVGGIAVTVVRRALDQ